MDVTLNENGNVEYAFKNFGRQKLLSMNYYMTQSGNVYVHLKNKRTGKSISLGHDEYGELIALSADVAKMAKRLTKENEESDNEVIEPPIPDIAKAGAKRKHDKGKGKGKKKMTFTRQVHIISDDEEDDEEDVESDDECPSTSRGKQRK